VSILIEWVATVAFQEEDRVGYYMVTTTDGTQYRIKLKDWENQVRGADDYSTDLSYVDVRNRILWDLKTFGLAECINLTLDMYAEESFHEYTG
jgi:hypothetical protein